MPGRTGAGARLRSKRLLNDTLIRHEVGVAPPVLATIRRCRHGNDAPRSDRFRERSRRHDADLSATVLFGGAMFPTFTFRPDLPLLNWGTGTIGGGGASSAVA